MSQDIQRTQRVSALFGIETAGAISVVLVGNIGYFECGARFRLTRELPLKKSSAAGVRRSQPPVSASVLIDLIEAQVFDVFLSPPVAGFLLCHNKRLIV
jgi:hypothetical protein